MKRKELVRKKNEQKKKEAGSSIDERRVT